MIRRNFFYIAAGAIAALFVPKVAGAIAEKTQWLGPVTLGKEKTIPFPSGGVFMTHREQEELSVAIRKQRDAAMESLAKGWEDYLWGSP